MVDHPYSLPGTATVSEAESKLSEHGIGGLVVLGDDGELVGLVSTRDLMFEPNPDRPIKDVMTPREKLITVDAGASLEAARATLHTHRLEKLPVVDRAGRLLGLITAQDIIKMEQSPDATKEDRKSTRLNSSHT